VTKRAPVVKPGQVRTLGVLLRAFLASVESDPEYAKTTRAAYRSHVNRLAGWLGDLPTSPTPEWETLDRYRKSRLHDGFHPNTVRQDLVILGAAWTWGRDHRHVVGALPRVHVDVPKSERYTPTPEEIGRIIVRLVLWREEGRPRAKDGLRIYAPAWVPLAARLVWATGARRSEISRLQIGDVRVFPDAPPEGPFGEIRLGYHEHARKTGPRTVPIGDDATAAALADWLARFPKAAPADGFWGRRPRTVDELNEWTKAACEAEGLPIWTPQGVRRAATDALYESGSDAKQEASLLGHSEETAIRNYRRPRASSLANAVRRAGLGAVGTASTPADVVAFPKGGRRK
jgi:integrase